MTVIKITLTLIFILCSAGNAMALQTHGAPEGIYVHQMAHILFIVALGYLYWHTRKTEETSGQGWKWFQLFCLFMMAWNGLAFIGHETYSHLSTTDFLAKNSWDARLAYPITFKKVLYYITKMDHFLIVPALFALVVGLRKFYLEAKLEAEK